MIICNAKVVNEKGLHVRPAARFVALASEFESSIIIRHGARCANGKSILDMMTLAARCGALLEMTIQGSDEERMTRCIARVLATDLKIISSDKHRRPPCR